MASSCIRQVLLLLFYALVMVSGAATAHKTDQKDQTTQEEDEPNIRPSRRENGVLRSVRSQSTARRAASAPLLRGSHPLDSPSKGNSHRMQDYSLAHHADLLSQNSDQQSSFENLLQLEKEHQREINASQKPPPRISPFFVTMVGSSFLFALSAFLRDPSSAQSLWKSVVGKKLRTVLAVAWLPWCWYHPAKFALVDMLVLIQLVRQPAALPYLQKEVLPLLWKTFHTMLITEVWARTWKWFFAQLDQVRRTIVKDDPMKDCRDWMDGHLVWPMGDPPSWMVELHAAVVGSVRKGIKSAFKKSIQETFVSAFGVWQTALKEQIVVAIDWNLGSGPSKDT